MTTTRHYMMTIAALLLAGCTATDEPGQNGHQLCLHVDATEAVTRADNDIQGSAFLANELVNVWEWNAGVLNTNDATYAYSSEVSTVYATKVMKVDLSNTLVPNDGGTGFVFPDNNKANIRAVYPTKTQYSQATDISMVSLRSSNATFSVQTDQSSAANYKASDLMYGLPTTGNPIKDTGALVGMTFRHMMSKVVVNITAGQGIDDLDGISVKLSAATTATVSIDASKDMTVAATGAARQSITINDNSQVTGKTYATLCAVIPPQEFPHDHLFITITRGDVTYTYAPTNDITFRSGSLNTFNITMELYKLTVTGNITPWNADGDEKILTGTVFEEITTE